MSENDIYSSEKIEELRDEIVGQVSKQLKSVRKAAKGAQGGKYGTVKLGIDGGTWTFKWEGLDAEYLRFEPEEGGKYYIFSQEYGVEPKSLLKAMEYYPAFIEAFNDWITSMESDLQTIQEQLDELPEVREADQLVEERDTLASDLRDVGNSLANEIRRVTGNRYGKFSMTIEDKKWTLKYDTDGVDWWRVGGRQGAYIVGKYDPKPKHLLKYVDDVEQFVANFNNWLAEQEQDIVSINVEVSHDN